MDSYLSKFLIEHNIKVKFVFVGIWNTIFGYITFILLDMLFESIFESRQLAYMLAMIIARPIAITNAFIFHKYVTFKSDVKGLGIIWEYFRFFTTYLGTFTLALVLLPFLVEVIGFHPRIGAAVIVIMTAIVSYIGHSRFSFRSA